MNLNLTPKDVIICLLVFIFFAALGPVLPWLNSEYLHQEIPVLTTVFSMVALYASLPVAFVLQVLLRFGVEGSLYYQILAAGTGVLYAFLSGALLSYANNRGWQLNRNVLLAIIIFSTVSALVPLLWVIDETPLESTTPFVTAWIGGVTMFAWLIVHFPVGGVVRLLDLNWDTYTYLSPAITGMFYASLTVYLISRVEKRKKA